MRSLLATLALSFIGIGCASSPIPIQFPRIANASAPEIEEPAAIAPAAAQRIAFLGGSCPLAYSPREVGSVVRIPAAMMSLAMDPVIGALCSCTKPGEYSAIVARIDFDTGQVQVRAPESSVINECLETLHVTFTPPPPSEGPTSDCINCGPRYYGVFVDSPPPPKQQGIRLLYSFLLDRTNEVLPCTAETHAERGACVPNTPPLAPVPDKPKCGCAAEDLMCAIKCSATQKSP